MPLFSIKYPVFSFKLTPQTLILYVCTLVIRAGGKRGEDLRNGIQPGMGWRGFVLLNYIHSILQWGLLVYPFPSIMDSQFI